MTKRKPTRVRGLGVTDADYARMLAEQGGGCPERHMDRDHDHITGRPRGLACPGNQGCNALMPRQLTLERARLIVAYLEAAPPPDTRIELTHDPYTIRFVKEITHAA